MTKGFRNFGQSQNQFQRDGALRTGPGRRGDLVCAYCKKPGHHKDKCWKLHGLPPHIAKAHMAQNLQQGGASTLPPPSAEAFLVMIQEL